MKRVLHFLHVMLDVLFYSLLLVAFFGGAVFGLIIISVVWYMPYVFGLIVVWIAYDRCRASKGKCDLVSKEDEMP